MLGSDPVTPIFRSYEINGNRVTGLLRIALVVESILEGHWDIASEKLIAAIANSWFAREFNPYCDAALPNLLINAVLGGIRLSTPCDSAVVATLEVHSKEDHNVLVIVCCLINVANSMIFSQC